jgi:hypothetical protein
MAEVCLVLSLARIAQWRLNTEPLLAVDRGRSWQALEADLCLVLCLAYLAKQLGAGELRDRGTGHEAESGDCVSCEEIVYNGYITLAAFSLVSTVARLVSRVSRKNS